MNSSKISFYDTCILLSLDTCIESSSVGKATVSPGFWLLSNPEDLLNSVGALSIAMVFLSLKNEGKERWLAVRS